MSNIYIKKVTKTKEDEYNMPIEFNHEEYFDLRAETIKGWIKENCDVKDDLLDLLEYSGLGIVKISSILLTELRWPTGRGLICFNMFNDVDDSYPVIGLKPASVGYKEVWEPVVEKLYNYLCDCILGEHR